MTRVFLHGVKHFRALKCYGLQSSASYVRLVRAARESHYHTSCISIPMR